MYHDEYYANFGGMTVEEYVRTYFYTPQQEDRFNQIVDMIPRDVRSILDVGAGFGHLLEKVEKVLGLKGVGIEITEEKVDYARKRGVDLRKGDISKLQFNDESFDIVISCEVIEHLPYMVYEKGIQEIMRVSRKYILVEVPFNEKRIFIRCPYCGATFHPNFHMRSFNESSMKELFPKTFLIDMKKIGNAREFLFADVLSCVPRRSWPPFSVCPSCGYRKRDVSRESTKEDKEKNRSSLFSSKNILKSLLRPLFFRKKPSSIVCLYQKKEML
jgi:SAM-dependent methyltransferase